MMPEDFLRGFYFASGAAFGLAAATIWLVILVKISRALWQVIA